MKRRLRRFRLRLARWIMPRGVVVMDFGPITEQFAAISSTLREAHHFEYDTTPLLDEETTER